MSAISCLEYHNRTSYHRHKMDAHFLDWSNQPSVFKDYPGIKPLLLPQDNEFPDRYLSHLLKDKNKDDLPRVIDQRDLARVFQLTYSLTARSRHGNETFYYRSAASAGALYPVELYVGLQKIGGLEGGIYHFSVARQGLHPLRKGGADSPRLEGSFSGAAAAPHLIFFLSAVLFRSSWKYRERAFRYHLLDTGHVLENLILALRLLGLPFTPTYDFDDLLANRLLGLDQGRETVLAMVFVPRPGQEEKKWGLLEELPEAIKNASRVSKTETPYPLIEKMVRATTQIASQSQMGEARRPHLEQKPEAEIRLTPPDRWPESLTFAESVFKRRSKRNFVRQPLSGDVFLALLEGLGQEPEETGGAIPHRADLLSIGVLVGQVEGIEAGWYLLDRGQFALGRLKAGFFTEAMAGVCLDQGWLANAALHFLFLADLERLDERFGPRGYRYAMMTAGRLGERLYLLATAMGLGCCGIGAFYDGEARQLLRLKETEKLLYLVGLGPIKSGAKNDGLSESPSTARA